MSAGIVSVSLIQLCPCVKLTYLLMRVRRALKSTPILPLLPSLRVPPLHSPEKTAPGGVFCSVHDFLRLCAPTSQRRPGPPAARRVATLRTAEQGTARGGGTLLRTHRSELSLPPERSHQCTRTRVIFFAHARTPWLRSRRLRHTQPGVDSERMRNR